MSPNTSASSSWSEDQPVVELKNVNVIHKSRTGGLFNPDTVHAVNDVSLSVKRGETLGLVGESGCGKSTTARVMVGLQPVTSGEVIFKGRPLGRSASDRRELGRSISVVFQDPATALNPRMIVHDALIDPLNVHGIGSPKEREAKVRDLLHLVGLPPSALNVLPRQISGGQRQRVAIARALALDPDIIVADEPTSALDVSVRAQVLNLLQDLKASLGLGLCSSVTTSTRCATSRTGSPSCTSARSSSSTPPRRSSTILRRSTRALCCRQCPPCSMSE